MRTDKPSDPRPPPPARAQPARPHCDAPARASTHGRPCDAAFPERRGWFTEYYDESRHWAEVPASFRSWPDYEDRAAALRDWTPSIVTGLLQAADYARALITVQPSVTDDVVTARLAARIERQHRVLGRDDPPTACFIVDELALYREVGSTQIMAGQLRHLSAMAAMPRAIVQVLPAIAHPANASGFLPLRGALNQATITATIAGDTPALIRAILATPAPTTTPPTPHVRTEVPLHAHRSSKISVQPAGLPAARRRCRGAYWRHGL